MLETQCPVVINVLNDDFTFAIEPVVISADSVESLLTDLRNNWAAPHRAKKFVEIALQFIPPEKRNSPMFSSATHYAAQLFPTVAYHQGEWDILN